MTTDYEFEIEEFDLPADFGDEEELSRFRRSLARPFSPRLNAPRISAPRPIVARPRPRPAPPRRPRYLPPVIGQRAYLYAPESPAASEYVRWVQTMLNQTLNIQLPVDGVMTVQTRSALRSFQEKNGLPVTGIVGPDTERALLASRDGRTAGAGATKSAEPAGTPPESGMTAPAGPPHAVEPEVVESEWMSEVNRSSRDYVKWVQQSLNQIMELRLAVDGQMGAATRSAIRSFQQKQGLSVDGKLGKQTEAAIKAALAPQSNSFVQTPPSPRKKGLVNKPVCDPAAHDLEFIADILRWLKNEMNKQSPKPDRLGLLRRLLHIQVDVILDNLGDYIAKGCCEPALKTLEEQADSQPWPADSQGQDQRSRLVNGIRSAQLKAKKDFQHC